MVRHRFGLQVTALLLVCLCSAVVSPPPLRAQIGGCPTAPSGTDESPTAIRFAVSVTPKGSAVTQLANTNGLTASFQVDNIGTCPDTYTFTASASGPITVTAVMPTGASLQPAAGQVVRVTYNVGAPGSGTLTLRAAGAASDNGSYNVTVAPPYAVAVTPDGAASAPRPANTGGYSETFTVKNTGYNSDAYTISCGAAAPVTCTGASPGSATLASGASQTVTASYTVGASGTGTLTLTAASANASDGGSYSVPVLGVAVTPDGQAAAQRAMFTSGYSDSFTVQNTGGASRTYTLTCTGYPNLSCTGVTPTSVTLNSGATARVAATYSTTNVGTGILTLKADDGAVSDTGYFSVPVVAPPGAPRIDASPYNYAAQDYARCAQSCFTAVYVQGTVPYLSLDAPRNVTLAYNGDRVDVKPFVHVSVTPDLGYGQTPSEYRLQLQVNGVLATFLNGEQTLKFAYPGATAARIGGQFDASSYATGANQLDILVSAYYAATQTWITNTWRAQLVVANETGSAVARGWTLAGVQRLYSQGDGAALVTEGGGSAVYFAKLGSNFVTPAGEFSKLLSGTPSGGPGWTRAYVDSTKVVFDNTGRMIAVRDRFANVDTIIYDAGSRVSQIKDPLNLALTLTYGPNGLSTIQDPGGRVTTVTVDASRRLTAIQDPDNVSTTFGYDASLRLQTITDRRGFTTTLGYDPQSGKLATITAPPIEAVEPSGAITTASPVTSFAPWQKQGVPYAATATTPATAPLVDSVRASVTEPGGAVTRFTVNPWGTPASTTAPLGQITTVAYDGNGLPVRVAYPTGGVDTVAYNASGLPTYTRSNQDSATFTRYAAYGQPDSVWGFGRQAVRDSIGPNGQVVWRRVGGTATTRFYYDIRGRVDSIRDAESHLVARHWYAGTNGNVSKDSLPGGRVTTYGYDVHGRRTSVSAPGLATQTTAYDLVNRPTSISDGVNPLSTTMAYDGLADTSVTDPKGQVYKFQYNALGWLMRRTDPATRSDTLRYSRDGELRQWTNRRGQRLDVVYDSLHRRTSKSGVNTASESWSYSADGRVVTSTDPVSTETAYLNLRGQPDSVRTALAGQTYWRRYRYTVAGLLDSVDLAGGGITFLARKYVYDAAHGILTELHLGGRSTAVGANNDFQATSVTFPGADQVTQRFFALHGVADISSSAAYGGTIARALSYDPAVRVQRHENGNIAHQFSYDGLGRLIADTLLAWSPPPGPAPNPCTGSPPPDIDENGNICVYNPPPGEGSWVVQGATAFAYDSVGNRRDKGGLYGPGNRITAFDGCTYATDLDGNVTVRACAGGTDSLWWSAEGRLDSVRAGTNRLVFKYDAAGRLIRKSLNGAIQSHFLWDGANLLAELNSAGTGKAAEYSYYPGLDTPHAVVLDTVAHYAHGDGLGSVIALTGGNQAVTRSYAYDAWGALTGGADNGAFANRDRARWKGALWLGPEVDLYYMRARWYEPKTGRFLSDDPIGLEGGLNPYAFGSDDPINHRDPTGQWCEKRTEDVPAADGHLVSVEVLHCEDIGVGDLWTIESYMGHPTVGLRDLWGGWGWPTPGSGGGWPADRCRSGFSSEQCSEIAEVQARLTLHNDPFCANLGVGSTRRFQAGKFRLHKGLITHWWMPWASPGVGESNNFSGTTTLSDALFAGGLYGDDDTQLYLTNVHEERHHHGLFGPLESVAQAAEARCA